MRITIIATGGTIAGTGEALSPSLDVAELLRGALPGHPLTPDPLTPGSLPADPLPADLVLTTRQVLAIDSSAMGAAEMVIVADAVADALRQDANAVVVLHGTDTMAETALLTDLRLRPRAAVLFTGAMRGADHPEPDGPGNIRGALEAARTARGVSIFFAGELLPVWGTGKAHTTDPQPFENAPADGVRAAALGFLGGPDADVSPGAAAPGAVPPRVDIVALHPGADRTAIDAHVAAGARGLVLAAMGAGNANPLIVAAVRDAVEGGVVVAVSTRVARGPVFAGYGGGGGGADLVTAGACVSTALRPGQTRILLAELLAAGATPAQVSSVLAGGSP